MLKIITGYIKSLKEYIQKSDSFLLFFLAPITGIGVGLWAVVFRGLIGFFEQIFFIRGESILSFLGHYYVIIIPVIGGMIVGPMIYFLAKEAKGHGVPEVMLAVAEEGGKIRPRVAIIKSLASAICIGSGGSVGREGPIVQIGSTIGSMAGQFLKFSEEKIKILVACGAAGGIAATFNTPLGGIFFAQEVILRKYNAKFLSSVVISAVAATVVSRNFLGNVPAFIIPKYQLKSIWEIPMYVVFAFLAGLVAVMFTKFLYKCEDIVDSIKIPEYTKPAIGGIAIGVIGLYYPHIFGVGYPAMETALSGNMLASLTLGLMFIKILATSLTLAAGGSGGVFAPSLFIGAMLGNSYGTFTNILFPSTGIPPGACALVGMAAVFAGVARAPMSSILILFEMTGDYKIILALMITCIISSILAKHLSKESIYTLKLTRRGINIHDSRHMDLMEVIKVEEAMDKKEIIVNAKDTVKTTGLKIKTSGHMGFGVIDENHNLVGIVTRRDINKALDSGKPDTLVEEVMTKNICVCYPEESLRVALEKLGEKDVGRLPVVNPVNPNHVLGLITREDIIHAYSEGLHNGKDEEL